MRRIVKININQYKYIVGIDCGVETGFGVWNKKEKRIECAETMMIHRAMAKVTALHCEFPQILVRVEDARLATYGRQKDVHKIKGAGSVMRDAKIWEDFLSDMGIDFEMVRPNKATTKLDANKFAYITGYSEKVSSHARDAVMMVFGF